MRIIAGRAKGTTLVRVPGGTRPLSDRAREGLFASLGEAVVAARVLDLYAGTGALGIEALSRGAAHATFVDRASAAIRAVRGNLERTGLAERGTVVQAEALRYLRRRAQGPFDLVFLDPPYSVSLKELEAVLSGLGGGWLAGPGSIIALTRPIRGYKPVVPVNWRVARRLVYGDTLVFLYREVSWP